MITKIGVVGLKVKDQDEALLFYTEKLGFQKRTDITMDNGYRWLTVAPADQKELELVLEKGGDEQPGGSVSERLAFVLHTDNCREDYQALTARGVQFHSTPEDQPYGVEVLFEDPYGNVIDLLEPRPYAG